MQKVVKIPMGEGSPPNKGHSGDANAVPIDCRFRKAGAFVERPEELQGAPLMAKTLGVLKQTTTERSTGDLE